MLSTNPERAVSCALFCKFIFTKPTPNPRKAKQAVLQWQIFGKK
jgi:hypothetical protein